MRRKVNIKSNTKKKTAKSNNKNVKTTISNIMVGKGKRVNYRPPKNKPTVFSFETIENPNADTEIKTEDTVDEQTQQMIDESMTFEISAKEEIFDPSMHAVTGKENLQEEDYQLPKLSASPHASNEHSHESTQTPLRDAKVCLEKVSEETEQISNTPKKRKQLTDKLIDDLPALKKQRLWGSNDTFHSDAPPSDFEAIAMKHDDLDAVMNFEKLEARQDNLLPIEFSTTTINDDVADSENTAKEDPKADPLYIDKSKTKQKITEKLPDEELKCDQELCEQPPSSKEKAIEDTVETPHNNVISDVKIKHNDDPKADSQHIGESQPERKISKKTMADKPKKLVNLRCKKLIRRSTRKQKVKLEEKVKTTEDEYEDSFEEEIWEKENVNLSPSLKKMLETLEVDLIHTVPIQHQIETTAGSRPPSLKQKQVFESHGPLRKGVFSPNEDEIIKTNWITFCEVHEWDPENVLPFVYLRNGNKYHIRRLSERQKFVQFLANGLPWRTLYSVYNRFKILYGNQKSNIRFSAKEDEKIRLHIKTKVEKGKNLNHTFSDLAKMLGRTRKSIWRRCQYLCMKKKKPKTTVVWTKSNIKKFIDCLLEVTLTEDLKELKDASIPKQVWLQLEKKLNINYERLRRFWLYQLHMQLFCPNRIYLNDVKIQLIEYFHQRRISSMREVIWHDVARYFDGFTTVFLSRTFGHLIRDLTIRGPHLELPDIISTLYEKKIGYIQEEEFDKYLPRLAYTNETITYIDPKECF